MTVSRIFAIAKLRNCCYAVTRTGKLPYFRGLMARNDVICSNTVISIDTLYVLGIPHDFKLIVQFSYELLIQNFINEILNMVSASIRFHVSLSTGQTECEFVMLENKAT